MAYTLLTPSDGLKCTDTPPYTSGAMTTGVSALHDGDKTIGAGASYFSAYGGGTVGLDLGSVKTVAQILLYVRWTDNYNNLVTWTAWGGGPFYAPSFSVYRSNDNSSWTFVETFSNPTPSHGGAGACMTFALTNPINARYVKVVCINTSSQPVGFTFTGGSGSPGGRVVGTELEAYDTVIECVLAAKATLICNSVQVPCTLASKAALLFNPVGTSTVVTAATHLQNADQVGARSVIAHCDIEVPAPGFSCELIGGADILAEMPGIACEAEAQAERWAEITANLRGFSCAVEAQAEKWAEITAKLRGFSVDAEAREAGWAEITANLPGFSCKAEAAQGTADADIEVPFPAFRCEADISSPSRFRDTILRHHRWEA
ncbi:MAG TPA: discoidin domain-containing protein [Syntrophobacter fumaroxidans]|nr:discoidin domain-containing protein [Syntrophobacter fumaroxidans]